jgi:hypothetical protein
MNPYYTHQKYLTKELERLDYSNPVIALEFGVGDGSSSVFKSFAKRFPNLWVEAYETELVWVRDMATKYTVDNYRFHHVDTWDGFLDTHLFDKVYDLVFVDQSPWEARIKTIDTLKNKTKVFVLHDYDYYNKGVINDLYCVASGSFFGDRYGDDFILQGNNEYPGTLIMRNKRI